MTTLPAGPSLDRLVAEAFLPKGEWFVSSPRSDSVIVWKGKPWMPTTDIADAWEVVERIRSSSDDYVFVVLDYGDEVYAGRLHYRQPIVIDELTRAATAPLAISLAALKALS